MSVTPQQKLNSFITHLCGGLDYKRRTRLSILSHWSKHNELLSSSSDLPESECIRILDSYFEGWRDDDALPTEDEARKVRKLAEQFSAQWLLILGKPDEAKSYPPITGNKTKSAKKNIRYRRNVRERNREVQP